MALSQNGVQDHASQPSLLATVTRGDAAMNEGDLAALAREALIVLLKLAGPVLIVGLVVGLIISMLQALTQINESTLIFIPKLIGVCVTIGILGGFMMQTLGDFTRGVFDQIIALGLAP